MSEAFYKQPLFDFSLTNIPELQKMGPAAINFFKFMTIFGYGIGPVIIIVLFYLFSTREKSFYLICVHAIQSFINEQLKSIYKDPRPYMESFNIKAYECSYSFGNPSGHASTSSCFYTSLFLILFWDVDHTIKHRVF